jgi:glyoxylase-like metal-dependent hydrolase (beta-lactamase superfamily II)
MAAVDGAGRDTHGLTQQAWTQAGAFAVAEGVYRMPIPLPIHGLRAVNVYALVDGESLTLIDSGMALSESERLLESALAELGRELGDVRQFIVTHLHSDHYGQASALRRRFGWRVMLGKGEQPSMDYLLSSAHKLLDKDLALLTRFGASKVVERLRAERYAINPPMDSYLAPDVWLEPNQPVALESRVLRALPTPGHTQGHLVYLDEQAGVMFTGDHLLPTITPSIGFEPVRCRWALRSFLSSLQLLRDLPDSRLLPAHGPVAPRTHIRAAELVEHHRARLDQTSEAVSVGATTAYEVARILRWTRRETQLDDLDGFNQMLAVMETQQHLDLLAYQERVRAIEDDTTSRFVPS